jgi:hypothetical protein
VTTLERPAPPRIGLLYAEVTNTGVATERCTVEEGQQRSCS